jgi:anti-anti-sigma regulatory factor
MTSEFYDEAIRLPAVQTIETVKLLHEEIRHHFTRLGPVSVDASQVESIDTASLQLLAITFISAEQVTKTIALHEPSPEFLAASRLLGLSRIFGLIQ